MKKEDPRSPNQLSRTPGVVPGGGPDDATVVRQVRSGNAAIFEVLVLRYQRPVYNAVRRLVGDPEEARDVAQDVFVKAFERLETFDDRYRFFSWIYRIAIHEALNQLKRAGRAQPLDDAPPATTPGPEREFRVGERARIVQEAISELSADHRAVLVMRHYLDCSYRDIADAIGVPESTVKSRLFEARRALRARLVSLGVLG